MSLLQFAIDRLEMEELRTWQDIETGRGFDWEEVFNVAQTE
jgi:hypothetical protein